MSVNAPKKYSEGQEGLRLGVAVKEDFIKF